jgi:hypothetical protein
MPFKPEDYQDSNSPRVTKVGQQTPSTIGPKPGKNAVDNSGPYSENEKGKRLSGERSKVAGNAR